MRPPAPTPPSWWKLLPIVPQESLVDGYYIFDGLAIGETSEVYRPVIRKGTGSLNYDLTVVWMLTDNTVWHYDENTDTLLANGVSSSGITTSINEKLAEWGYTSIAQSHMTVESLSKTEIIGKLAAQN